SGVEVALSRADRDLAGLLQAMLVAGPRQAETEPSRLRRGLGVGRKRQQRVELLRPGVALLRDDERASEIEPSRGRCPTVDRGAVSRRRNRTPRFRRKAAPAGSGPRPTTGAANRRARTRRPPATADPPRGGGRRACSAPSTNAASCR